MRQPRHPFVLQIRSKELSLKVLFHVSIFLWRSNLLLIFIVENLTSTQTKSNARGKGSLVRAFSSASLKELCSLSFTKKLQENYKIPSIAPFLKFSFTWEVSQCIEKHYSLLIQLFIYKIYYLKSSCVPCI
jgi:hypothetical protein